MPSHVDEAPAHERQIGRRVEDDQLAHRIAEEDVRPLVVAGAPERYRVAAAPGERRDPRRPVHVAGNEDEEALRHRLAHPGEGVEHHLLLALVGARRDPYPAARSDPMAEPALARGHRHRDVQLGVAGDHHPAGRGPDRNEPRRIRSGLGGDGAYPAEGGRKQAPES